MVQRAKERFYPIHPTGKPVSPELLNTHQRLAFDNIYDTQTAFSSLMAKITTGTLAITVGAGATTTFTVNLSAAMLNAKYVVNATVEGANLQVVNVLRAKNSVQVAVQNLDGANPHSGTIMVWAYNPQS